MYCDFKTLIDILYMQIVNSTIKSCNSFMSTLFTAYIYAKRDRDFDTSETSKLSTGERVPSKSWVEFYKTKDRSVLLTDIDSVIPLFMDKDYLQKSLYELIANDDLLSDEYRKLVMERNSPDYTDDTALSDLIYDALMTAMTRKYKKDKGEKYYRPVPYAVSSEQKTEAVTDKSPEPDDKLKELFSNSQYIPPCEYFCGRDAELVELHTLIKKKSKVTVVGTKSIGKSEFIRGYIEKYGSEYEHIGYYSYSKDKKSGARPTNIWRIIIELNGTLSVTDDECDKQYESNLKLLSSLGKKALLVIDNFNVPADYDENLPDVLRLKCDVILISHMNYDDMTVYKLREFRRVQDAYALIQKYYPFNMGDGIAEFQMRRLQSLVYRNPFLLHLCGRKLQKGIETPTSLADALSQKGMKSLKTRISLKKDGEFQGKATYHDHVARLMQITELNDAETLVLSYMRFVPDEGVSKRLFAELLALDDINVVEDLIEIGFIREENGGLISISSIIRDIIECDIPIAKEEFVPFTKRFFALDADAAAPTVLTDMADNIMSGDYWEMYEPDYVKSTDILFKFNYKMGDIVGMDLLLSAIAGLYDHDYPPHVYIFNEDKRLYSKALGDCEEARTLKKQIDMIDERCHSGVPLPSLNGIRLPPEIAALIEEE